MSCHSGYMDLTKQQQIKGAKKTMTKNKRIKPLTRKELSEILQVIKHDKRCNDLGISYKVHKLEMQTALENMEQRKQLE